MGYFAAFRDFHDGDYEDAERSFRSERSSSIKTIDSRWIDSICYETMLGECYYHMGHLDEALGHYTAAVQLVVAHSEWMRRVQFPAMIPPSGSAVQIPWGVSTRKARRGRFPKEMSTGQGRIDNNEPFRRGGVVQRAYLRPIHVQEIIRCTTLAIRRRAQLLGPARQYDMLTEELVAKFSLRPGRLNHWSESWIDIQLGVALMAAGKEDQALPHLQRSLLIAGEFDHPLTSIGLLELGRLALSGGNYPAALRFFEEATYSAVHYPDPGILEEAFRGAALAYMLDNRKGVYPRLAFAAAWAKRKRLGQLHVSLLLLQAENYAVLGETSQAALLLQAAQQATGRRDMAVGRLGARYAFLRALVFFQQHKIADGNAALATATGYMQRGSYWLFHIKYADRLYTSGTIPARTAMDLYTNVLRDPQPADWAADPMESMAVLMTPHPGPIERWFEVAMERKAHETALEIADRARRHRFYSSLAFGGRLVSLRRILEGPDEGLDRQSLLLRQDLLARYPAYEQHRQQVRVIRDQLKAMPLVAVDQKALQKQSSLLGQLADHCALQEAVLRQMAVRREPAGLVFPPLRSTKEIQESLPDGHAVLVFFATSRHLYGFLLNNERYTYWRVGAPAALQQKIVGLLRAMGHYQANHELAIDEVKSDAWKQEAQQVLEALLAGSRVDLAKEFDELAIVPDGLLWYVPFEALQVKVDGKLRPLISRFRIRYAPTASLATSVGPAANPTGNTAVVTGRLYPRDDEAIAQNALARMADVLPGTVGIKTPLPAPSSIYASLFDRLIVLDDLALNGGPYSWAPVPIDRGRPGSSLGDWLSLPWDGPREVILPGFHTAAETSLKGLDPTTAGHELFLAVCGLMSGGSRTILLSRWRTGGATSFDLVREFAQELPHTSPAEAWRRSVFLTAGSRLNLEQEPRIKRTVTDEPPKANHPFFWSGYLLIDSGSPPAAAEEEPKPAG